jgi:NTE family protein
MPFCDEREREGMGLALSGGGFRAMLFHLGAVWRLNELALLPRLDRIAAVSGGALLAGRLAARWEWLRFEGGVATNFVPEVAEPVWRFAGVSVDLPAVLLGLLPFLSAPGVATRFYRRYLVGRTALTDLPERPQFVLCASHLSTGTSWRFTKRSMGTYRLGLVDDRPFPLALALAASAAFPPFLAPLTLHLRPEWFRRTEGADLHDRHDLQRTVALTDGGVYDNLALESVWCRYRTVLISDAGGYPGVRAGRFGLWPVQLLRVLDVQGEQARALRRRAIVADFEAGRKQGTIWRTGTDITEYPAARPGTGYPFPVAPNWRFDLATVRTRLNPFTTEERARLVNWGYLVADVALRSYVVKDAPPPASLPFPAYDFAAPAARGGRDAAGNPERRPEAAWAAAQP